MFARVIKVPGDVSRIEDASKTFEELISSKIKPLKGFVAEYMLVNRDAGQAMSIGLWETEEDCVAVEQSGALKEALETMAPYMTGTPDVGSYEITAKVE